MCFRGAERSAPAAPAGLIVHTKRMSAAAAAAGPPVELLCWWAQKHVEFRLPELAALAEVGQLGDLPVVGGPAGGDTLQTRAAAAPPAGGGGAAAAEQAGGGLSPFLKLRWPSEAGAAAVARRAVLLRGLVEVWGEGADYAEAVAAAEAYPAERKAPWADKCFLVRVEAFGKKLKAEEMKDRMERFSGVGIGGKVELDKRAVEATFWVLEDHGAAEGEGLRRVYFGRQVSEGGRGLPDRYDLKKRAHLGPTSMDAELSLLCANMGCARPGTLALDPFAGTGSLMLACAHFGSASWGAEIHAPSVRGKKPGPHGKGIRANYTQYGLPAPQLVIADFTRPPWVVAHPAPTGGGPESAGLFDLIVCDPPYGIREGCRSTSNSHQPTGGGAAAAAGAGDGGGGAAAGSAEDSAVGQVGGRKRLAIVDAMDELLAFAATSLAVGGRLVYWLPTTDEYEPADRPTHPRLSVLHDSGQRLSGKLSRRLITMVKLPVGAAAVVQQQAGHTAAHHNLSAKVFGQAGRREDHLLRENPAAKKPRPPA